jgi:uncharacterized cupin superfamily protein
MAQARLENGVPVTAGWFVVNARDAPWERDALRTRCRFGGSGEAHFDDLGVGLYRLEAGGATALYHHEAGQEDFLVLQGHPLLIAEGVERPLEPFDLAHCPPRTPHTIVAPDGPALILAVGARKERGSARYPPDPVAARHGVQAGPEPYAGITPERAASPLGE